MKDRVTEMWQPAAGPPQVHTPFSDEDLLSEPTFGPYRLSFDLLLVQTPGQESTLALKDPTFF